MIYGLVRKISLDLIDSDVYHFENEDVMVQGESGESFADVAAELDKRVAERTIYYKKSAEMKKIGKNSLPGIAPIIPQYPIPTNSKPPVFSESSTPKPGPVFNPPSHPAPKRSAGGCPANLAP